MTDRLSFELEAREWRLFAENDQRERAIARRRERAARMMKNATPWGDERLVCVPGLFGPVVLIACADEGS